jgi:hypothetical protein
MHKNTSMQDTCQSNKNQKLTTKHKTRKTMQTICQSKKKTKTEK